MTHDPTPDTYAAANRARRELIDDHRWPPPGKPQWREPNRPRHLRVADFDPPSLLVRIGRSPPFQVAVVTVGASAAVTAFIFVVARLLAAYWGIFE